MKFSTTQIVVSTAFATLVKAQVNCSTDIDGLQSVLNCGESVTTCATTLTKSKDVYSCLCSYFNANVACQTSICGDTYPTTANFSAEISEYCGGGATATATTATSTTAVATTTGSGSVAGATASSASKTNMAGSMVTPFPDQAALLAAAGLIGALL